VARRQAEWIVGGAEQISAVRRALGSWLAADGCSGHDDILLVFSELVTNAVRHGGGSGRVGVEHSRGVTHLEVRDRAAAPPAPPAPGPTTRPEGGFGLRIVGELSTDWGWRAERDGKVVWAIVPCASSR
jgi:anti-sigma regulatory factor (Ser/Thr protein kinase)